MKKLMLALLTIAGLMTVSVEARNRCGSCPKKECAPKCAPKCEKPCSKTTYSQEENGQPCCVRRFVTERTQPAHKHVHTITTYTCPTKCETYPNGYQCVVDREITAASGAAEDNQ